MSRDCCRNNTWNVLGCAWNQWSQVSPLGVQGSHCRQAWGRQPVVVLLSCAEWFEPDGNHKEAGFIPHSLKFSITEMSTRIFVEPLRHCRGASLRWKRSSICFTSKEEKTSHPQNTEDSSLSNKPVFHYPGYRKCLPSYSLDEEKSKVFSSSLLGPVVHGSHCIILSAMRVMVRTQPFLPLLSQATKTSASKIYISRPLKYYPIWTFNSRKSLTGFLILPQEPDRGSALVPVFNLDGLQPCIKEARALQTKSVTSRGGVPCEKERYKEKKACGESETCHSNPS